jgi:hypothetical protein
MWLGFLPGWGIAAPVSMRAVILFDTSGSMRKNDPHRLSWTAAQLFVALAHSKDAVGLVAFSDRAVTLVPLTSLSSPEVAKRIQSHLAALRFTGQTTDLAAALEAGLTSFPQRPNKAGRDLVLLLTDGKLDLGRARRAEEAAALARIRQTLLPQYRRRGIALYTIAFSSGADQALLREMARETEGEFRYISSATQLHEAFSDLFMLARQAESLPMAGDAFLVDDSIEEAALVFSKHEAQERIRLVTPQREMLSASNTKPGVTWTSTPSYDLVQLKDPDPGPWRVKRPAGAAGSIGIVGASTLRLHVELQPAYREAGEPVVIRAFLEEKGQRVRDPQRLQQLTLRAEVITPQEERHTLTLEPQEAGLYATTLRSLHAAGHYSLRVMATSPQLRRQRTLSFTVNPPCFQPTVEAGPPVMVRVTLADACPTFRSLVIEARRSIGNDSTVWIPLTSAQPGVFVTTFPALAPGQTGEVSLRIRGRLEGEEPFTLLKGPWPLPALPVPPAPPWKEVALFMVVKLLIINGVLVLVGGGGGGIYYCLKRRRSNAHV